TSYRLKKRYHRLKDGEFVDLNSKDVESLSEMTSSLGLSDDDIENGGKHYSPFMSPYIDEVFTSNDDFQCEKDSAFRTMMKDFTCFRESEDEVPSELNAELRPYQKDGFRWLKTLHDCGFGGILADEMGLGKTVQVIAFIACLKEKGKGGPSLVVCPSSLVYNWEAEVRKFAPSLNVMVVSGIPSVRRMLLFGYREADVIITSYDSLKRDTGLYEGRRFHLCFLDEAQYIKNHDTEAAKSVKKIESDVRFALTGTPIENRLSELWSIFDFLMSGYLRTYDAFRTEFEIPVMKEKNREASVRLQKLVSPFILRRLKSDVLKDLPEKLEEVSLCELTGEQRKLYDARVHLIRKDIENSSDEEFSKNRLMILSELTRLRQLCCDPSLCYENFMEPSAKLEATMELIERAIDEGHRMLLFSQFTSMLSRIAAELDRRHIMYFTITGATAKEERVRLVDAFNRGNTPVFLISLKAGGTGLNLTGADVVIHYDPWWNGAVQDQATDRAHRIGQTKVVTVYSMIAKDTIEEKIKELQESKKDLADEILSGEHVSLSSLSRAELLDLLS
ncbi:MAG: SNF2-related protein, partial [Bullifex sp.]